MRQICTKRFNSRQAIKPPYPSIALELHAEIPTDMEIVRSKLEPLKISYSHILLSLNAMETNALQSLDRYPIIESEVTKNHQTFVSP